MKNEKGKLFVSDIIQAIGLLGLLVGIFIGLLFYNNGSLLLSAAEALVLAGILYGLVYVLVKLKKAEENLPAMRIWELLVLILGFGGTAVVAFYFFTHFINIEFSLKQQIKAELNGQLNEVAALVGEYENYVSYRVNRYQKEQENEVRRGRLSNTRSQANVEALQTALTQEYTLRKPEYLMFVRSARATVASFNRLELPQLAYNIPIRKNLIYGALINNSQATDADGAEAFAYNFAEARPPDLSEPARYLGQTNWPLAIVAYGILLVLVLWPYLFATRSARKGPSPVHKETNTL